MSKRYLYALISLGISLAVILMMYIDSRITDKPKQKKTYVKNILLVNMLVFGIIFLSTWFSNWGNMEFGNTPGSADSMKAGVIGVESGAKLLPDIAEEMLVAVPEF